MDILHNMKYLGIDIGVRNLSFCLLSDPDYNEDGELVYNEPLFWKDISILDEPETCMVVNCKLPSKWKNEVNKVYCGLHKKRGILIKELEPVVVRKVDEYTPFEIQVRMISTLNKYPELYNVDYIFIENQPIDNGYMKGVASSVFTYFTKGGYVDQETPMIKEIAYISATKKTKNVPIIGEVYVSAKKDAYKRRKDTSIEYCRRYCNKHIPHLLSYFESHRKKDDLADSYMMCIAGMWYINIRDMHSRLELADIYKLCEKNGISLTKSNGKLRTCKQLSKDLETNWVWVNELILEKKIND